MSGGSSAGDRLQVGGMTTRYRWFRMFVRLLLWLITGFRVYGAERVPEQGPLIVASNHTQYLDPVYVSAAVPRRVQWMAKKELFVFPFRWLFALLRAYPVDRQKGGRAALRSSIGLLEDGGVMGIFPEGTHRQEEGEREAKSGVVVLGARSSAPVLPVYMSTAPGPLRRLRGEKMYACIGRPISVDGNLRGGKAYREVADGILREIYALPKEYGLSEKP